MNFLDQIWLIPLFPLAGAALMLLIGKKLDPQPASDVADRSRRRAGLRAWHGARGTQHARAWAWHGASHDHGHGHAHSPLQAR